MGLVRNLKKKLGRLAEKILVELSYHYIIQRAKQTSRKPDSSLSTEFSQKLLTTGLPRTTIVTSSPDILERTTMELKTTDDIVSHVRSWSIDKIEEAELTGDKIALYAEFEEWIEIEDEEECEIISLDADKT